MSASRDITRSFLRVVASTVPAQVPNFWTGQALGLGFALAGTALRFSLTPLIDDAIPVVLFYPFVLAASIWGGTAAGVAAWIWAGLIADYFLLPPPGFSLTKASAITLAGFSFTCLCTIAAARVVRESLQIRRDAEERAKLLLHETKHRAMNLLGVVQSISAQTARTAANLDEHQKLFNGRVMALARAQQLISDNPTIPADFAALIKLVLEPFGLERFSMDGPPAAVAPQIGASCALLFHELGTNATKYGALSGAAGMVMLKWSLEQSKLIVDWVEVGGPPVQVPSRKGFGTRLLQNAFPPGYGKAALNYDPQGLRCSIELPRA